MESSNTNPAMELATFSLERMNELFESIAEANKYARIAHHIEHKNCHRLFRRIAQRFLQEDVPKPIHVAMLYGLPVREEERVPINEVWICAEDGTVITRIMYRGKHKKS